MTIKSSRTDKIQANVLFQGVDKSLLSLLKNLKTIKIPENKIIFEDGSKGDYLYLVLDGNVKISKILKTGEEIVFGVLHEGDFFGELDLIDKKNRSARATTVDQSTFALMDKKEFDAFLKASPEFVSNLLQMAAFRLRSNNLTYILHQESSHAALQQQFIKTHHLVEASKIVNSSLDVDQLLDLIFKTAARTVGADRGTLYLLDKTQKELWSKVQQGSSKVKIRLPIGTGIAGSVAATGNTINISDAYKDPRFNSKIDQATGYRTKSVLCMPMLNREGKIIGVFQLLNKGKESFTKEDEEFIEAFSVHAALALENAQLAGQMVQNERLSAVGRMASTIIHDIKNPMGVLRLSAQVIRKKTNDEETVILTEEMIRQIDRFIAMTQEILDFARGASAVNFKKTDLQELIEIVLQAHENDFVNRNIKVIKNLKFSNTMIADPDKLMRSFYNIVGNAADAMPDGGKLTINTFKRERQAVVEFIDTGIGMTEEIKARLVEPFFTYGKKHGTGLGMAIVKKIIDDHKGKIEIESIAGRGTTIRLLIPIKK